ncbi:MAG: glycosyltransferase family 4 protein, partial [Blastocatellia bacterium]|nr:glycosyltransferase family 4 protein [Blastocatellia bacterium]
VKREAIEGIDLLRTWVYCTANKGFFRRILNFFSFFFSSLLLGSFLTGRPDVVIGTSPQFFCAVAAYLLSLVKGAPFVIEVRDIWPQSAVELGALKNTLLIRALEAIELHLYRSARLIVVVAESTKSYLMEKGIAGEKIKYIPNGIDPAYLGAGASDGEKLRNELDLHGRFIVSYIGTHGMSHALDVVLQAAQQLQADATLHFLFVGEGAEKEKLKRQAADLGLNNVTFLDERPREGLAAYYRASDVSIVPLRRLPLFKKVLPSKLFELMGVGCPIICSVEGEAAELVARAGAGLCIEAENHESLIAAIGSLRANPALRRQLGLNGRRFAVTHHLRSALAEDYLVSLSSILECQIPPATEGKFTIKNAK